MNDNSKMVEGIRRYHFDAAWSGETLHANDCLIPWKHGEWCKFSAVAAYGDARYKAGVEAVRKEIPDVVVGWSSGATVGIKDTMRLRVEAAEKRIKALIWENEIWQDKFNRQTQAVKDIALMKAGIQVQYHLTVARAEAAEATRQFLLDQSSRWEAQALEAGVRIVELEALVRRYQEKADALFRYTSAKPPKTDAMMAILTELSLEGEARAVLAKPQEGKE